MESEKDTDIKIESILEIVDADFMQNVQDFIAATIGVALLSICNNKPLVKPSNYKDFCIKCSAGRFSVCDNSNNCLLKGENEVFEKKEPLVYKCPMGLTNFAIPARTKGKYVGCVIGGQYLTETPDKKHFKEITNKLNINEDKYLAEMQKIQVISTEKAQAIINLLYHIANSIVELAYANLQLSKFGLDYKSPRNIALEEWLVPSCQNNLKKITDREFEVLKLIVLGKSNTEIAKTLFISVHTAKAHVSAILEKLDIEDRVQAAVKATREGLI